MASPTLLFEPAGPTITKRQSHDTSTRREKSRHDEVSPVSVHLMGIATVALSYEFLLVRPCLSGGSVAQLKSRVERLRCRDVRPTQTEGIVDRCKPGGKGPQGVGLMRGADRRADGSKELPTA